MTANASLKDETKRVLFKEPEGEEERAGIVSSTEQALPATSLASDDDQKYVLPDCIVPPPSELEPVETFVKNAIRSKHEESPDPAHAQGYRAIIDSIRRPQDPSMVRSVFISLRTADDGSVLTMVATNPKIHAQLIHVIFRFISVSYTNEPKDWDKEEHRRWNENTKIYKEMNLMDSHLHLILALVSAKSAHLIPGMKAVWRQIKVKSLDKAMYKRLHAMNYKMMELFPKVRTDFFSIVSSKFPHIKWDKAQIIHYTEQSFKVLDYLPSMRKQLFEIVIDKCLEIDVNIKIKDNGDVLIEEQQKNNGENSQEQRPGVTKEEEKKNNVDEFSDKLDSLLALLLDEIRKSSKDGLSSREMYYELLPMFESTILTTHKAKYVQFCIFYACGLESELLEDESDAMQDFLHAILHRDFAAKLLETIIDPYRATLTRQSGACYLASFISRASFVGPDTICESISVLLRWAEAYIESVGQYAIRSTDSREQSELHSLFYTVCQAAFYIMCFRGTEAVDFYKTIVAGYSSMVESGDGHSDFPDPEQIDLSTKRWTFICTHDLQPLRYCLESVRSEFLHIAHAFELIEEDKLDKLVDDAKRLSTGRVNKRAASKISTFVTLSVRRQKGGVGGLGRGSNPLKSFFPFDPLLLRRCYDFLEPYYRHWQGPVEEEDVLSIDDGSVDESSGDDEEIFELDGDDSRQRIPAVVSDPETKNNITTDKNDANNEDDNYDDDDDHEENSFGMRTPDVHKKKEIQRKAWSEATKRPRSLSMENGSW